MTADLVSGLRELVREVVREELDRLRTELAPPVDRHLSVRDAAALAGVAEGTVRRWVREGRLTSHHAGRVLRIRASELDRFLSAPRARVRPPAVLSPEERARRDFG